MPADFRMPVLDLFTLSGLGVAVTGRIESGTVNTGDDLSLVDDAGSRPVRVVAIEVFGGRLPKASAGPDEIAVVLSGVTRDEVRAGHVLLSPGAGSKRQPPRRRRDGSGKS
jgi:translation elongation factor EF-Tu-like GTPase